MTEAEWLAATDPDPLLIFLDTQRFERKLRLFACACCRRITHLLVSQRSRDAVLLGERLADGLATEEEVSLAMADVEDALDAINQGVREFRKWSSVIAAHSAAESTIDPEKPWNTHRAASASACAVAIHGWELSGGPEKAVLPESIQWSVEERQHQTKLLSHVIGNPFRPFPAPPEWPSTVAELAHALYAGNDNRLILADALEEAGHQDLAEHFRKEEWHPKGCWVVDMILGKS
jgi:hypothetical protein